MVLIVLVVVLNVTEQIQRSRGFGYAITVHSGTQILPHIYVSFVINQPSNWTGNILAMPYRMSFILKISLL